MTTPLKLQPVFARSLSSFLGRGHGSSRLCEDRLDTAFSTAPKLRKRPLTLPVAPRVSLALPGSREEPGPLPLPLRQTRAAFPARSAFHRHVLRLHSQAVPATDLAALPPRSGFRRFFTPPMLSHERARSSSIARAKGPGSRGPHAACRLLQPIRSSGTTAGPAKPRSPCPGSPPSAASSKPSRQLAPPQQSARTGNQASFEAQPAERSQVRGKVGVSIQHLLLSSRSLVMKTYPQPVSARTPFCRKPASV